MAISTLDGLIAALGGSSSVKRWALTKGSITTAAGAYHALFTAPGIPGAAANPSSGVAGDIPTDATAGALPFTNPSSPALSYLTMLAASANAGGTLYLYDRLWHNSGLSATSTSSQTVNSTALTRPNANGDDAELWLDILAATGSGANAPTVSYTDAAGNTGNTGTCIGYSASSIIYRTYPFQLASGDTGVRSVQSYTNSVSMSSGTIALVIRRKLATIQIPAAGYGMVLDGFEAGLPQIPDDACLELLYHAGSTSVILNGLAAIAQG
jgi:hypothetical protein